MQCMNTTYGRSAKGFTLVEVIVALIVLTVMLGVGAVFLARHDDDVANETVAGQMQRLGDAVSHYVDDNYTAIIRRGITPLPIDWTAVKPYLPAGIDQNTGNPIGTRYDGVLRLVTLPGGNQRIDALIYTVPVAGANQPDVATHSMKVAQIIGAGGLYLDHDNRNPGAPAKYWGSYGEIADQASMSTFFGTAPTAIGQIFYAPFMRDTSTYGPGTLAGDLLHRKKTSGHADWNQMETDIDMNSHKLNNVDTMAMKGATSSITDVGRVDFSNGGKHSSIKQDGTGTILAMPASGTFMVSDATGTTTGTLRAKEVDADANVNADTDVKAAVDVEAGNDLIIDKHDKVAGQSCPSLGHVGMDSDGNVVMCKSVGGSLAWQKALTEPSFDHAYTGRHTWYSTGGGGDATYGGTGPTTEKWFENARDVPAFVSVSSGGVNDKYHAECGVFVYEATLWNGSQVVSAGDWPIAMQQVGMHDDHYNKGYTKMDNCNASFVARPHTSYLITALNHDAATISYTY